MYSSKKIVLDFDGTIFRVFTNYDLHKLVEKIFVLLQGAQIEFTKDNDAFDAFDCVMNSKLPENTRKELLSQIDNWLKEAELEALPSGILIEGFAEFLKIAKKLSIDIAIVSNNSAECISSFLNYYDIRASIPIIGRNGLHPETMKPNTYMLEKMSRILKCENTEIIYVGDNYRDYQCATSFGCQFIGMTPTSVKKERLCQKAPNIMTVENFYELAAELWQ
jgi:phosphoglycolate phosphatase-like HAD superfamily hydrolase